MYVHVRPLQNHNCINYILYTSTVNSLGLMKNCLDHVLKSQNLYMDWIFYIKRKKIMFWIIKISFFIKSDWRLFNTSDNLLDS